MPIATDDLAGPSTQPRETPPAFPALKHFKVQNVPPAAYYVPEFVTAEEEAYILRKLSESPQPKWKTVGSGRRLQYWGGTMSSKGTLLPEPLPDWLVTFPDIVRRIDSFLDVASGESYKGEGKVLGINQVLVNEYSPGQGISPHEDGPAFRPLVATLSLGSHTILDIHHYLSATSPSPPMTTTHPPPSSDPEDATRESRPIAAIPLAHLLLLPRSLLILSSSLYTSHLHGITAREKDTVIPQPMDSNGNADLSDHVKAGDTDGQAVTVANEDLLGNAVVLDSLRAGSWKAERGVRTSLTFRHANKVLKGGALSIGQGVLRRT